MKQRDKQFDLGQGAVAMALLLMALFLGTAFSSGRTSSYFCHGAEAEWSFSAAKHFNKPGSIEEPLDILGDDEAVGDNSPDREEQP